MIFIFKEYCLCSRSIILLYIGEVMMGIFKGWVKEWLSNFKNIVLLLWIIVVVIFGVIFFMVMVGMLNVVFLKKVD